MGPQPEGRPCPSPSLQGQVCGSHPSEPLEPKGPRESQPVAGSAPSFGCGDSPWSEEVPGSASTLRACGPQKWGPSGVPILLPEDLATVLPHPAACHTQPQGLQPAGLRQPTHHPSAALCCPCARRSRTGRLLTAKLGQVTQRVPLGFGTSRCPNTRGIVNAILGWQPEVCLARS